MVSQSVNELSGYLLELLSKPGDQFDESFLVPGASAFLLVDFIQFELVVDFLGKSAV